MGETMYEITVVTDDCQENFSLTTIPGENTNLVKRQQKKLSAELDLNRLITNLNNSSTLLYIAYNALSGTPVQSKVSGLQNDLSQLCAKSQIAMNDISLGADNVLRQLPMIYKMLMSGKATAAMKILATCSVCAGKMADTSEELAREFETMTGKTQVALESSQDLYASDLQKRQEIEQQINEMTAKQAALKEKEKQLGETIKEVQEKYNEAQKREEKAEKNALIFGIVNIVSSSLAMGLGALANTVKTQQTKSQGAQNTQDEQRVREGEQDLTQRQNELEESETAVRQLKEQLEAAERELATIVAEPPAEGEEAQAACAAKKTAAEQKVKELKDKIAQAESNVKIKKQAVVTAQAALEGLSQQLAKEREEAKGTLEKAQATTSELFQLKLDMQRENREIASSMAEIAVMLKNQTEAKISADKAVEMLKLAIRCLGNVVVAFTEAALFWRTVEQGCNNLKEGAFITQVQTFSEFDSELQNELYGGAEFKALILEYMATWVALHCIGRDYYQVSVEAGKNVRKHIQTNLFEEDAFKEAARLAEEIMTSMQMEEAVIDSNTVVIEEIYSE